MMKTVSQLIKDLQVIQEQHGDLPVETWEVDAGRFETQVWRTSYVEPEVQEMTYGDGSKKTIVFIGD